MPPPLLAINKLRSLSCVLLAYQEEDVIETTIRRAEEVTRQAAQDYEIIVVGYAGCKDRTNAIVEELSRKNPALKLVLQKIEERGYGRAFALGLANSSKEWIFQTDADGQYNLEYLAKLLPYTQDKETGLIHGYRSPRRDPVERIIFAGCYNTALRWIYPIALRDVDSAFKLIRGAAAKQIHLEAISGFAISEFILKLQKLGYKTVQMPIEHLPRQGGAAMADKSIKAPFGLQIPNFTLVGGTLKEMWDMRKVLR